MFLIYHFICLKYFLPSFTYLPKKLLLMNLYKIKNYFSSYYFDIVKMCSAPRPTSINQPLF